MRVQIYLPERAWDRIREDAAKELRPPKKQIEYVLLRALGLHPANGAAEPVAAEQGGAR